MDVTYVGKYPKNIFVELKIPWKYPMIKALKRFNWSTQFGLQILGIDWQTVRRFVHAIKVLKFFQFEINSFNRFETIKIDISCW